MAIPKKSKLILKNQEQDAYDHMSMMHISKLNSK